MLERGSAAAYSAGAPDPPLLVHVDGPLFERVLINLLENVEICRLKAQIGITAQDDGSSCA